MLVAFLGIGAAAPAAATPPDIITDPIARLLVERGIGLKAADLPSELSPQIVKTGFAESVRDHASDMVMTAMKFLGVPYARGGQSEAGFDCSGFTRYIFERSVGLMLPRRADEQANAAGLMTIRRDELKPGDLVFFNTLRRTFSHVGIYVGDGNFIHAPKPGAQVRVENMGIAYWSARFTGARRPEVNSN